MYVCIIGLVGWSPRPPTKSDVVAFGGLWIPISPTVGNTDLRLTIYFCQTVYRTV